MVVAGESEKDWKVFDGRLVERRKAQMIEFKEEMVKRWRSKLKEREEDGEGYLSKLILKVLDNLQV